MKFLFAAFLLFSSTIARTAIVDTVSIYSKSMKRSRNCIVIRPVIPEHRPVALPTVYLLHGYGGDYTNWLAKVPRLKEYADAYQLLIVCPDGDYSSWYFDSPVDTSMKYETYIAKEVPAFIDSAYPTIKDRSKRAITGLSMGGHGAFFIAFRHAAVFGACGSMSGGVDLRSSKNKYDISKRLGDTVLFADRWTNYSVINAIEKRPSDSLAIIFDCGIGDAFYADNKRLHEKMLQRKIAHEYIERPGNHSWAYWANAVQYQLLYFRNYFDRTAKK